MEMDEKLYDRRLYLFVVCMIPLLMTVCGRHAPLTICGKHFHTIEEPRENIKMEIIPISQEELQCVNVNFYTKTSSEFNPWHVVFYLFNS